MDWIPFGPNLTQYQHLTLTPFGFFSLVIKVDTAMKVVLQSIEGDIPLYFLLPAVASKNFIVDKDVGKVKTLWEGQKNPSTLFWGILSSLETSGRLLKFVWSFEKTWTLIGKKVFHLPNQVFRDKRFWYQRVINSC